MTSTGRRIARLTLLLLLPSIFVSAAVGSTQVAGADTTPPVISPQVAGTSGANGWYTGPATVTWSVGDPESGIAAMSGCAPTNISGDTIGQTVTCSATN